MAMQKTNEMREAESTSAKQRLIIQRPTATPAEPAALLAPLPPLSTTIINVKNNSVHKSLVHNILLMHEQ